MSTDDANPRAAIEEDRLAEIRDARRAVRKARFNSRERLLSGRLTRKRAALLYRSALESLLMELKPYADYDAVAQRFWTGFDDRAIGHVVTLPPLKDSKAWLKNPNVTGPGPSYDSLGEQTLYCVNGLLDVLDAPEEIPYEYVYRETVRYDGWVEYRAPILTPLGYDILDTAFDWARQFAAHVGFDIDPTDRDSDRELDAAALLTDDG